MRLKYYSSILLLWAVIFLSCGPTAKVNSKASTATLSGASGTSQVAAKDTPTVEEARKAITQLAEAYSELRGSVNFSPKRDERGHVIFGRWDCDLTNRRFEFFLANDVVYLEIKGEFVRSPSGRKSWIANVTSETRAH